MAIVPELVTAGGELILVTAIRTRLVVAGCTCGDAIRVELHIPEEGFTKLNGCGTILDVKVKGCRKRYRDGG
jgi:hypothetical protein